MGFLNSKNRKVFYSSKVLENRCSDKPSWDKLTVFTLFQFSFIKFSKTDVDNFQESVLEQVNSFRLMSFLVFNFLLQLGLRRSMYVSRFYIKKKNKDNKNNYKDNKNNYKKNNSIIWESQVSIIRKSQHRADRELSLTETRTIDNKIK